MLQIILVIIYDHKLLQRQYNRGLYCTAITLSILIFIFKAY